MFSWKTPQMAPAPFVGLWASPGPLGETTCRSPGVRDLRAHCGRAARAAPGRFGGGSFPFESLGRFQGATKRNTRGSRFFVFCIQRQCATSEVDCRHLRFTHVIQACHMNVCLEQAKIRTCAAFPVILWLIWEGHGGDEFQMSTTKTRLSHILGKYS